MIYQEFAEKSQMARIAALDHHRSCLPDASESEHVGEIRLLGRNAYRNALMTSYAVELQGPEEVAARANECISSLRDLLNCAEEHEARSTSGVLTPEDVAEMDEQISARFNEAQRKLQLFIRAGCAALDRPMPPN
ncbi:hypothetical protein [Streptomyces sp. NPDC005485]|uniref:hypothetical protein n=1 Tax=Streptomyces sp. NPDC005485 TaxID=3155591 RepID=UPI0033AD2F91